VTEKLGYRKLCGRWVPKMLTDDLKTKRMGSALNTHALRTGRRWVSRLHCDWRWNMGFSLPSWIQATVTAMVPYTFPQNQKIQNVSFIKKVMASVFWDRKCILLVDLCLLAQQL